MKIQKYARGDILASLFNFRSPERSEQSHSFDLHATIMGAGRRLVVALIVLWLLIGVSFSPVQAQT